MRPRTFAWVQASPLGYVPSCVPPEDGLLRSVGCCYGGAKPRKFRSLHARLLYDEFFLFWNIGRYLTNVKASSKKSLPRFVQ